MKQQLISAVFEKGIFRPLSSQKINLLEGQHVQLSISTPETPEEMLDLASSVYAGLSEGEIDQIEQIALDRSHFFETPDSNRE